MPEYSYQNKKTGEIKNIIQRMSEPHTYEENGEQWERIFAVPQASIGANIDPFSKRQFLEKTSKPDSYGSMLDRSQELSDKRAKVHGGVDPIRAKAEADYSKTRRGKKHTNKLGAKKNKTYYF